MKELIHCKAPGAPCPDDIFILPILRFQKKAFLIMKITGILLLAVTMSVSAASMAQKVTLSESNSSLKSVFKELRRQTGYYFIYNDQVIRGAKPVTVNLQNQELDVALQEIFRRQDLSYSVQDKIIIVTPKKEELNNVAPPVVVRGKVTDSKGEALIGVSVRVKGSTQGTSTNTEGSFTLRVDQGQTLVFTYVGFQTREIVFNGQTTLNIILNDDVQSMEEVVVVGYGTQKKSVVTSSVSMIDQKAIRQTPGSNIQNMLTGKVTGYFTQQRSGQPGAEINDLTIRGAATYTGNNAPLILVDNVEYNYGQFKLINADEIESISVLKDAEATAIYGVKGANGVILVTTRRGKAGKTQVSLRTETGLQIPVRTFQTLDSYDAARLYNEALVNDGLDPFYTETDLDLFRNGTDPYGHPNVDWYNTIFRPVAPETETNLNFSGGTERIRYFLSLGYLNQSGLLRDIKYMGKEPEPNTSDVNNNYYSKRYKFRSNLDVNPTRSLTVSFDLTGTYNEVNQPNPSVFGNLFKWEYVRPFGYPVYNPDGSFGFASRLLYQPRDNYNNPAALTSLGGYSRDFNPFMNIGITATQHLDALIKGLTAKASATYSYANLSNRTQTRSGIPSYYYNPADGSYTPRDNTIYRVTPYTMSYAASSNDVQPNYRMNIQAHLSYERKFNGAHSVNALVLYNQTTYTRAAKLPFKFLGYTYRFGYNYKERYIFSASGAYNGSDRFVTQKRFTLFPAFGVAWNLHNEPFFAAVAPFINQLKIRSSWGITGNDDIQTDTYVFESTYARAGTYSFGESPNNRTGIQEGVIGNDDVSWESERKWNLGADIGLFKNALTITADYFRNYRYDIFDTRHTIPVSFGIVNLPKLNLGKVRNHGFELEVGHTGKVGKIGYNLKGNISYAKNSIVFNDDPPALYPWQDRTGMSIGVNSMQYIWDGQFYTEEEVSDPSVAKPAGTVRAGYLKYRDMNNDGIINVNDKVYINKPNRQTTILGFNLGFDYKGLSVSALLQAGLGGAAYAGYETAIPFKAEFQPLHLGRWTPETAATATFPALTTNFVGTYMNPGTDLSTFWSQNTDYLRLRSMEVGYTFSAAVAKKLRLSSLRVFANGYNLATWSGFYKRYQFDPEVASNFNDYVYPVTTIVNFGLSVGL